MASLLIIPDKQGAASEKLRSNVMFVPVIQSSTSAVSVLRALNRIMPGGGESYATPVSAH